MPTAEHGVLDQTIDATPSFIPQDLAVTSHSEGANVFANSTASQTGNSAGDHAALDRHNSVYHTFSVCSAFNDDAIIIRLTFFRFKRQPFLAPIIT